VITRRQAVQAASLTALSYSRVRGANDRIGLGVIGTGGRGIYVMGFFQKNPEVEVRALCDIYPKRLDQALDKAPGTKTFLDHRELLQRQDVDAVLVASPDHWHKDHAVDTMNAGKDVYVEKPLCRTRDEAPQMVRAARAHNRICQVGVQQRSGKIYLEALDQFVRPGALGRIVQVDAVWHSGPPRPLPKEPVEKPANLDWIRYLGPVHYRDWVPAQYLNFRAFLDFNGGKLTDFGHHWLDVAHMYLGERAPHSATFAGGLFHDFNDGRTAPDTCNALFEYENHIVFFQSNAYEGSYGVTFSGEKGKLYVDRHKYEFKPAGPKAQVVTNNIPGDITADHVRNFLDCCKSRKLPNGDVALAAISIIPPLLAVESYITKRKIRFDPELLVTLPG
jgi:predicted dehydrogenase